jgi:hypothetical protein
MEVVIMANTPRFCPKCGLPVEEGARFCQGCGTLLPALRSAAQEPDTTPNKRKVDTKPFLVGCAVLMVIGVVFAVFAAGIFVYRYLYSGSIPFLASVSTPVASLVAVTQQPVATLPPTEQPAAPPTIQPPTPLPPVPTPNIVYEGIRLSYDPAVTDGYRAQSVPAVPPSDQVAPWDVAPQHVQIDFSGYSLKDTFHKPALYIYLVSEYEKTSETAAQIIADLRKMLAERPQQVDHVPFLPVWNAGPMIHARMSYLDFQNGSGARVLTQYGQAIYPINNQNLFYTFQGLTADGKYYVSFVLPIANPVLPATGELSAADYNDLEKNYQSYIQGVVDLLNNQPAESFTPDLGKLDRMVQSLEVK